jgi:hypothetical protein
MRACPDTWPNFDAQYLGDRPIRAHGTPQFSISAGVIGAAINRSGHSVRRSSARMAQAGTRFRMSCTGRSGMLAVMTGALLLGLPHGALNFIRNCATEFPDPIP